MIHPINHGASEICITLHTIQKFHKVNDNISNSRHGNLPEHFTLENGVSIDLTTAEIITGSPNSNYNNIRIIFRAYTQVDIGTTNSTKQRTVGAISLHP